MTADRPGSRRPRHTHVLVNRYKLTDDDLLKATVASLIEHVDTLGERRHESHGVPARRPQSTSER